MRGGRRQVREGNLISYRNQVEQAVNYLAGIIAEPPEIVVVLGTGLGSFAEQIDAPFCLPYAEIPGFPQTTVSSHAGKLVFGRIAGRSVAVLQGRFHYYEGYSARELTLPLRVMSLLGAGVLIVTNSAGGLNPDFTAGSLMIINDHINFIPDNPLRGANVDGWGSRFPDLSAVYDKELIALAGRAAERLALTNIAYGVYGGVPGPSLETPAETRYLRACGIDAVGMSTVPEVIVARHASMRVLGVSVIANINDPDNFRPIFFEDVVASTGLVASKLTELLLDIIADI